MIHCLAGKLYSDRDGARNHCTICCTCKEPNSVHCKVSTWTDVFIQPHTPWYFILCVDNPPVAGHARQTNNSKALLVGCAYYGRVLSHCIN